MPNLLTAKELAEKLSVSHMTIHRLRKKGLPVIKLGRSVRFDLEKVSVWIDEQNKK
jgi:excisionase family DNA binding protein